MNTNIYFIQEVETGNIKIGKTSNIESRLNDFQTGTSNELKLVATMKNCDDFWEKKIHRLFHKNRVRGEWFAPSEELKSFIILLREIEKTKNGQKSFLIDYLMDSRALSEFIDNLNLLPIEKYQICYKNDDNEKRFLIFN